VKSIAILSPVFNELETIKPFLEEITQVKSQLHRDYDVHIYLIDDGTTDGTFEQDFIGFKQDQINVVKLKKNFGHQCALFAGLQVAQNHDYVIVLDSDLQDPPNYILKIIKLLNSGFEIVMTRRVNRYDSLLKKLFAYIYYRYLKIIFQKNILLDSGDFWGVTGNVVHEILSYDYRQSIYFRGLLPNLRKNFGVVEITRNQRMLGYSKYGLLSMLKLGYIGIINSSHSIVWTYIKFFLSMFLSLATLVTLFDLILELSGFKFLSFQVGFVIVTLITSILSLFSVLLYLRLNKKKKTFVQIEEVKFLS
jgi:hypothetical protein